MTIQVFGSQATVSFLNRAFSDTSPSNAIFKNQVAAVDAKGELAFANAFAVSWAGLSNAALSKQVLTNVGVLPSTEPSVQQLEGALADYFAAAGSKTKDPVTGEVTSDSRGTIVLQLAKILSGLEGTATGAQAVYNTAATAWNNEVLTAYSYSSNAANTVATTPTGSGTPAPVVTTFTLTKSADTITGTTGSDTIDGSVADSLTQFDNIDGGDGVDSLNVGVTVTSMPSGVSIKNVENITLNASGVFATPATLYSGVTNLAISAADNLTVADGGTATVNAVSAGGSVTVTGGKVVNATAPDTKTIIVAGTALTTVSVKGGSGGSIENTPTTGTGTTMTAVTLDAIKGIDIKGSAITNLTWKNQITSATATITNGTSTTLALNVDGVGYGASGVVLPTRDKVITGSKAATVTVNATGAKSAIDLEGGAVTTVTTVNLTGSAALDLGLTGTPTALTKIDGSAATGAITLATVPGSVATLNTGSGKDEVTLVGGNTIANVNLGAGDDIVFGGAITMTGTVDGGAGIDSVGVEMFAKAAGQFKNFELLEIGNISGVTSATMSSTMTGLTLSSSTTTAGNTVSVSGIPAAATLTVTNQKSAANLGESTLALKTNTSADAFTVNFAGTTPDTTPASLKGQAGTVNVNDIENLNIVSGGSTGNNIAVGDTSLQTLTVTGAKDLVVAFTAVEATKNIQKVGTTPTSSTDTVNGVKLIDGSAATGKVTIDASPLTFKATQTTTAAAGVAAATAGDIISSVANAGLTIKGGTNADTITGTMKGDTIIGGGGADSITGGLGADKITVSGNTSVINITSKDDNGVSKATVLTQPSVLTADYDIITGATAGTKIAIQSGSDITAVPAVDTAADTLMGKDSTVMFARGTYNASTGAFSFGAAGADTAMTYDVNTGISATADFHTVILVGYVPSATGTTAAYASNIATITL
jgi:S-layer protein